MTKSATPPPARSDVVEIEAMDLAEWESGQSTPQTSDANLAELVRRSAATPEAGTRRTPATRERTRTQIGAPVARPPGQHARTAPPGPAPRPTRARASADAVAVPSRVPAATATPVQPAPTAPRSAATGTPAKPAPAASPRSLATPPGGVDFSLPVTASGEAESPPLPAPPRAGVPGGIDFSLPVTATGERTWTDNARQPAPPSVEIDFSLPVTSTGETTGMREAITQVRPPSAPGGSPSGIDFAVPVTASSKSGARRPDSEPPANAIPSPFAEASHVGPGSNASPPGGPEANTAWPPRPVPVDPLSSADRAALDAMHAPDPEAAEGAERLQVLSRRRLVWIVGAIGAVAVAAVIAAATLGSSGAPPPAAQATKRAGAAGRTVDPAAARAATSSSDAATATAPASTSGAAATVSRAAALPDPMARAASAQRTWRLAIGAVEGITDATVGPAPRPKRRTGPTRVVIDYRTRPNEAAPAAAAPQSEDDPAIASARGAYNRGNQRLFVGDLEGAVHAYQESLDLYPGYVGGYRGLGLAYAELGEKSSALEALKAYVAAAPAARDVALIKKRIARLQGK